MDPATMISVIVGAIVGILAGRATRRADFELVEVQPLDDRLYVLGRRGRKGIAAIGSVTTWRDMDGELIDNRATIEWLYALWLAHKRGLAPRDGA